MIPIAKYAEIDQKVRLRPSVSWVERENAVIEFFFANTRKRKSVRVIESLVAALRQMDGKQSLAKIAENLSIPCEQLLAWTNKLIDWSAVERMSIAEWVESSPWRRTLHMLEDFIPDFDLQQVWQRIGDTQYVILGCGAVGSWVADGIVRMGGRKFLLVDPDRVAPSNLNRSLFSATDVGAFKTLAISQRIRSIKGEAVVTEFREMIASPSDVGALIESRNAQVLISCMDHPSVDVAAGWVNQVCIAHGIPLVIAGGYNLHLSLLGITIIPGQTACFECSLIHLRKLQAKNNLQVKKLPRPYRNIGNVAPLAAITASIASMEAVRVAANHTQFSPSMTNRRGEFNFMDEVFGWIDIPRQPECKVCSDLIRSPQTEGSSTS
nr:ThiF family adenylyltransferase [uncultured Noviherbaspirillum sp.]